MGVFGWVLAALAGWTAIGLLGTGLALATRDRRRAWRGIGWIVGVWAVYLTVLLVTAKLQDQKTLGVGQEECFGMVCYSVVGVRSGEEFKGTGGGRLVQVGVRVRNGGTENLGVEGVRAYLMDSAGGQWEQTRGLGGVALSVSLPAGGVAVSEPVFRVEDGAAGLGLVLTRGYKGWGWLVIGNTDSLAHKRTVLLLKVTAPGSKLQV